MKESYQSVTQKRQVELDNYWLTQLAQVNEQLDGAIGIEEYQAIIDEYGNELNDTNHWNGLSLCLRRYIYTRFTGRDARKNSTPFSVSMIVGKDDKGQDKIKTYHFSPIDDSTLPIIEELHEYADLLYRITLENRCFAISKTGMIDEKRGAISKRDYLEYLQGKEITRKRLFVMSMALDFDTVAMEVFSQALGESPVYNFRDADECIYYFCHMSESYRSLEAVRRIQAEYQERTSLLSHVVTSTAGETELLHNKIDTVIWREYPNEDLRKESFIQYLVENHQRFTGYSKTAQNLFLDEVKSDKLCHFNYAIIPRTATIFAEETTAFPHFVRKVDSTSRATSVRFNPKSIGNDLYEVLIEGVDLDNPEEYKKDLIDSFSIEPLPRLNIKYLSMDSRIKENLVDRRRLNKLIPEEADTDTPARDYETISKKDFLLLRFYKLSRTTDFSVLSEKAHKEVLEEFHESTDRVLEQAGLPEIYVGNPFDHLILTALCDKDPQRFFPRIFRSVQNTRKN